LWSAEVAAVELTVDLVAAVELFTPEPLIGARTPIGKFQSQWEQEVLAYSIPQTLQEVLEQHQP
jgi:hypothetical protein